MNEDEFKEILDNMGIRRGIGPRNGYTLLVPCQKEGSERVSHRKIAAIEKDGIYYNLISLALPYFHGPNWRNITGGKPVCVTCESWDEVLLCIQSSFAERWNGNALIIDDY